MPPSPASAAASTQKGRWSAVLVQRLLLLIVVLSVLMAFAPVTHAQDVAQLKKDLLTASDFRVRVSAALALGRKKDTSTSGALTQALRDDNGTVRAAAAAALGSINDPSVLKALEKARDSEKDTSVKQSMDRAIATLKGAKKTKYLVSVARIENKSGDPKVSGLFTSLVKSQLALVPGVEIMSSEQDAVDQAKQRKLPTIALDGKLTHLAKSTAGSDTAFAAKVEFVIRKIPEQSLKATVKGDAKATTNTRAVKGEAELSSLREDAVRAAVSSAMKGTPTAIEAATK